MATHVWDRVADGTAYYCAQCRMRVDTDEFSSEVEDSLCVPYVPTVAEHVSNIDLSPGGVNYVDPKTGKMLSREEVAAYHHTQKLEELTQDALESGADLTLEEFAKFMGFEVTAWQLQVLKTIDNDIRRKKVARGIPH